MDGTNAMDGTEVFWLSAFLDFDEESFAGGVDFWLHVTGFERSTARGATQEFATLIPADGDDYLRVQRLGQGPSRVHLDLHVTDPQAAARRAVELGATLVAEARGVAGGVDYVVLKSPAGITHCFVAHPGSARPRPVTWPTGHHSMVYQLCLDIPRQAWSVESEFWARLFNAPLRVLERRPEFSWLIGDRQFALDLLLQRLDRLDGLASLHVDLGTNDRDAEVARHLALGAETVAVHEFWTVMRDPTGAAYCITDRDPITGRLTAHRAVT